MAQIGQPLTGKPTPAWGSPRWPAPQLQLRPAPMPSDLLAHQRSVCQWTKIWVYNLTNEFIYTAHDHNIAS
jgi:hypothetical protein